MADTLVEREAEAMPAFEGADALEEDSGGRARSYGVVGGYARAMGWSLLIMALAFGVFLLLRSA